MLRVSAFACSIRCRSDSKCSAASMRPRAARRGFSRPLSRACRTTPQALSMSASSSRVRAIHTSGSPPSAISDSSSPMRSSSASIWWAALRSRSGGHTSRLTSRPTAMPMPVSSSRDSEHARVVARAGGQHHERGGRRGRGLGPQPAHRAGDQADQDREPERQRVEAEDAAERERHQHAEHGRADLLDAAAQRAVDGGVDGEQRGPRGEERLLDVEHVDREHPRDDRREDRLDDLQRVRPPDRIPEPSPHAEPS